MSDLDRALEIAVQAHKGQKDKAGAPYVLHPLRLMMRMHSPEALMAAVLHDVVEDTDWTLDDLKKEGFSEEVLEALDHLTWRQDEKYGEYIERLKSNPLARVIKLADLEDNMDLTRIARPSAKDFERVRKYHKAWARLSSQA
ncbi:metal dependent phosphohydrolase [Desulfatibacillum aliphaticivorans]|uniref:Metal dependent phosphohydrolase n=1 Tax=Desulfatibacillum aliphaticivorans TaxID=218208 RepID=B8FAN4_DESAL|nr:HD domain-containing protein [Desulfatibacillum aliphaticivorans]ACL03330.1 metal dependent phosphohydrolase [Desulfatibacillum aliphaticivorans]